MAENTKVGCFVCEGCGIGEALDVAAICAAATDGDAATAGQHAMLCAPEGLAYVREAIARDNLGAVVIAACSVRAKHKELAALDDGKVVLERVSLREQVAWITEPKSEDAQLLAQDYVRMASAKAARSTPNVRFQEGEFSKGIVVVGGGVAGMTAALEAARAGYETTLLEKEGELGGFAAKLQKSAPHRPPYTELEPTGVAELVAAVKAEKQLTVLTSAEIEQIEGAPCKFAVSVKTPGKAITINAGAIVVATGFEPYAGEKLGHLGYGKHADVVTSVELEAMAQAGKLVRPSNGEAVRSVLFVQCAGSRDPEHLPYCSTVCCNTTLKQSLYLKAQDAEAQAYVLYKDLRTPGQGEEFYRQAQRQGTVFIRGELQEVSQPNGKLKASMTDVLLDETVELEDLDLIVLATGMVSTSRMEGEGTEPLVGDAVHQPKILKLKYRQGPELPNLRYGMPDSHYICFPYETRRTGIYAAGTVRRAMDLAAAKRDGRGAALKAIQCVEVIPRGEALHPRAGDTSYPHFELPRCTQCKRCTEECPFGAINEDAKANPQPNPTRCRRCGVCMGACPERIISFPSYSVNSVGAMIKAVTVPEEDDEKPCVLALICENDALPLVDELAAARRQLSPYVRFVPLRCAGSTNLVWIADALSKGIDGVLVLGCKHGDDYQCHFIKGSQLCETRLTNLQDTLQRLVLEKERVQFHHVSMNDSARLATIVDEFMETIEKVGPNPYKGF